MKLCNNQIKALIWVLTIGFMLISTTFGFASEQQPGTSSKRIVQYSFTIRNTTSIFIKDADFYTYGPVKQTSIQRCNNIHSSHPHAVIEDKLGNQILHFSLSDIAPFASKIIRIRAELFFNPVPEPEHDQMETSFFSQKPIYSDNSQIINIAQKLASKTPLLTAKKIYSWVANNIQYTGYSSVEQGAAQILHSKKGDCTEFMSLFSALARYCKIPARELAGYVQPQNGPLNPADFHNWSEFLSNDTWIIADPQKRVFNRNQSDYIAMRIIGPVEDNPMGDFNRFRLSDDRLSVRMGL